MWVIILFLTMARRRYRRSKRIMKRRRKQKGGFIQLLGPLGQMVAGQIGLGVKKRKQKGVFFSPEQVNNWDKKLRNKYCRIR